MQIKRSLRILCALSFVLVTSGVRAGDLTPVQVSEDFEQYVTTLKDSYAMLPYKTRVLGVRPEMVFARYRRQLASIQTVTQLRDHILKMSQEFWDGHLVPLDVSQPKWAVLPIKFDFIDRQVVVSKVPDALAQKVNRGDILLEWNRKPLARELGPIFAQTPGNTYAQRVRMSIYRLTDRPGSVLPLPAADQTKVVLTILTFRNGKTGARVTVETEWKFARVGSKDPRAQLDLIHGMGANEHLCSGKSRIELPPGATVLHDKYFMAYTYPSPRGRLGYLRIPHYAFNVDAVIPIYKDVLTKLQAETKGLVIDQDHNCGGYGVFGRELASFLLAKRTEATRFTFRASQAAIDSYVAYGQTFPADHPIQKSIAELIALLKKTMAEGKAFTPITHDDGVKWIEPKQIHSRPILMLVDEMAASYGDMMPEILRFAGRVKLFGTTTAGAGGVFDFAPPLKHSKMYLAVTIGLQLSPNGTSLENFGMRPDVFYRPDRFDFLNGYRKYREAYTKELMRML